MQLKKCPGCGIYTMQKSCHNCSQMTIDSHYKFKQLKDAPKDSAKHFEKIRKKKG